MSRKNKKHLNITNTIVFDDFQPEVNITDVVVPDRKKRVSYRASLGTGTSNEFNGQQITPFTPANYTF